jgi:hypothetical protein
MRLDQGRNGGIGLWSNGLALVEPHYEASPNAGRSWDEVEARIRAQYNNLALTPNTPTTS